MTNGIFRRIEVFANLAIILVAVVLVVVLARTFLFDRPTSNKPQPAREEIKAGAKISLAEIDWAKSENHLILVLQKDCRFCTESASFYQRLARGFENRGDLQLIAVLPHTESVARKYLSDLGITIREVRQQNPAALSVYATPTLLLVDKTGTVIDVWTGKLRPEKESEVLSRLQIN